MKKYVFLGLMLAATLSFSACASQQQDGSMNQGDKVFSQKQMK